MLIKTTCWARRSGYGPTVPFRSCINLTRYSATSLKAVSSLAIDGQYYGTTVSGGTFGHGTIFKMSQDGTVTKLHDFTGGSDGANPYAAPIQSVKGDFYGTTQGCCSNYGSVYRITKYGNFTLLHAFTSTDGRNPFAALVQGTNYYFYGTTMDGGAGGNGTIFRVSSTGDFKVLVNFWRDQWKSSFSRADPGK